MGQVSLFRCNKNPEKEVRELKISSCSRTNVLDRYLNKDFTLTLPDNKRITDIKWFAVYDLSSQVYRITVIKIVSTLVYH